MIFLTAHVKGNLLGLTLYIQLDHIVSDRVNSQEVTKMSYDFKLQNISLYVHKYTRENY